MAKRILRIGILCAVGLAGMAAHASAAPIVMTFEGYHDYQEILSYNGASFTWGARAARDSDIGGIGHFGNEPSASTVLFFTERSGGFSFAAGFDSLSFWYSAGPHGDGLVQVFNDLFSPTGPNLIAAMALPNAATPYQGCGGGDPGGNYTCWSQVTVPFTGAAQMVVFSGVWLEAEGAIDLFIDDITLGFATDTPAPAVPEPATLVLFGTGLATTAARWRRARQR